jgi:hypothetical protein
MKRRIVPMVVCAFFYNAFQLYPIWASLVRTFYFLVIWCDAAAENTTSVELFKAVSAES